MPLDRINGELIGEGEHCLGHKYRVVPNCKWRETELFEKAAEQAQHVFLKEGALWPVLFDDEEVLTQEYPEQRIIAMVFTKTIRGIEYHHPHLWTLKPDQAADLKATGRWDDTPIN